MNYEIDDDDDLDDFDSEIDSDLEEGYGSCEECGIDLEESDIYLCGQCNFYKAQGGER